MTPDQLRAAIAADCPHRLVDYDRHLASRQPTAADVQLWRIEHAISSRPDLEAQLDELDRQAQDTSDYAEAKSCLEQTSRIRHQIAEGLT
ncbi:hypothetical protein ACFXD5_19600 [Streptomyces sp. NPDC059385]|uniref:hypothetical protein n=1 Tax=Streptomyces sp. NPDC059385 TaxID=3346817 RepID=UPI00367DD635